jgi:hypothetical protein
VKQRRALLESNPPRDNWIDGDEIESVSAFGEAKVSPNETGRVYFRAGACLVKLIVHLDEGGVYLAELLAAGAAAGRV